MMIFESLYFRFPKKIQFLDSQTETHTYEVKDFFLPLSIPSPSVLCNTKFLINYVAQPGFVCTDFKLSLLAYMIMHFNRSGVLMELVTLFKL